MPKSVSITALQEELAITHKRNELVIEAAKLGTWDWNIETGEVFFNEFWSKMLGYEHHEIMSNVDGWADLLHPDDVDRTWEILQANLDGKTSFYICEHRLKKKDGSWMWVQARGMVIEYDEDGKPLKHTGTTLDINEQKLLEQDLLEGQDLLEQEVQKRTRELHASEVKFSTILQLAPEGIFTTTSEGNIQLFNEGAERLFGYSAHEIIGQHINRLIDPALSDKHNKYIKQFRDGKQTKLNMAERKDVKGLRKDGSSFAAKVSISKINIDGELLFIAIVHDISELVKTRDNMADAMKSAELANRAKSDFLANMSHELRTPLNAIIGYAQLIEQEIIGPIEIKGYKEYAEAIHTSGIHLLSLIQDILDISKIEAKKQDFKEKPIKILEVVRSCQIMVREAASDGNVDFQISIQDTLPLLFADEKSLKQIILNLLTNAIKFTPSGGRVTFNGFLDDDNRIICEVVDTGVGIKKEDLPSIMTPFTQVKNDIFPTAAQKGTGLGLSIVKAFTDVYGADFTIDSEVGVGTTVRVAFPSDRTLTEV